MKDFMRCIAYCTAYAYRLKPLYEALKNRYQTVLYRDVIHVKLSQENQERDVFYFSFGVMVCWGASTDETSQALAEVKRFEEHPLDQIEEEEYAVQFGDKPKVVNDTFTLPSQELLPRLAISHGLAQSVKLSAFELAVRKTIDRSKRIPEELASWGRVPFSRREIRKKMGELFVERNSINLHFDVLDTPEFFWEYPDLEPLYQMAANYLDVSSRVRALNQKLSMVHELFEMLGNELHHQHATRLELIVILLILIEVALSILQHVFRLF